MEKTLPTAKKTFSILFLPAVFAPFSVPNFERSKPTTLPLYARATELDGSLSRDGFHLSYGLGRYIAGMTFLKALTGVELDTLRWMPDGTTEAQREIAIRCANNAIKTPFSVTPSF